MLWKNDTIGGGYFTPSVVGNRVYLLGDKDKVEYLIALDAANGKEVQRCKVGPVAQDGPPSGSSGSWAGRRSSGTCSRLTRTRAQVVERPRIESTSTSAGSRCRAASG